MKSPPPQSYIFNILSVVARCAESIVLSHFDR